MSMEELELMPYGFIKKYGTFVNKIAENQELAHLQSNRDYKNRWREVRGLSKLSTNEEKEKYAEYVKDR